MADVKKGVAGQCAKIGTVRNRRGKFATLVKVMRNGRNKNCPVRNCVGGPTIGEFLRHKRTKKWYVVRERTHKVVRISKILHKETSSAQIPVAAPASGPESAPAPAPAPVSAPAPAPAPITFAVPVSAPAPAPAAVPSPVTASTPAPAPAPVPVAVPASAPAPAPVQTPRIQDVPPRAVIKSDARHAIMSLWDVYISL